MQKKELKAYDYNWIDFLTNGNTVLVKNEKDFKVFKDFLKQHDLLGILKDHTEFENWRHLSSINNMKEDVFLFEYTNHKGLTWSDSIEESVKWYEKEPLNPEDLFEPKEVIHSKEVSYPTLDRYEDIYIIQYNNFYAIEKINKDVGLTLHISKDLNEIKNKFEKEVQKIKYSQETEEEEENER